jgi:hypothetical protein
MAATIPKVVKVSSSNDFDYSLKSKNVIFKVAFNSHCGFKSNLDKILN